MAYKYKKTRNNNIKVNDRLLKVLAEECLSPKDLIRVVLSLKGITSHELGRIIGKSDTHIAVILQPESPIGPSLLYEIAVGLDINPTIVFRCWADWKLKLEQEVHTKVKNNNQTTI